MAYLTRFAEEITLGIKSNIREMFEHMQSSRGSKLSVEAKISHTPEAVNQISQKPKKPAQHKKQYTQCKYCGRNTALWHEKSFQCSCQQKPKKQDAQRGSSNVHELHEESDSEPSSDEDVWTVSEEVNTVNEQKSRIQAALEIKGHKVINMQIDTGATCNVMPKNCLPKGCKIKATKKTLITYSKSKINVIGKVTLDICNPKTKADYQEEFVVVDSGLTPLIGAKTAQRMELLIVQRQNIMQLNTSDVEGPTPVIH